MAFQIGFTAEHSETKPVTSGRVPRKSVVQVWFSDSGRKLAYYNDRFDLKCGDLVYVEGQMAGVPGRIVEISYSFKIKLSEYKQVIAVINTEVHGRFLISGFHLISLDPAVLSFEQVLSWFHAPAEDEEEYAIGTDDAPFPLEELRCMNVSAAIAERGRNYYLENRVRYLRLERGHGRAIVEGSEAYELEFKYQNGEISGLVCSCPCSCTCKHAVAAMLQLRETLEFLERQPKSAHSDCFTAIDKGTLFTFAVNQRSTGSITLD